ncbi:MAG: hypothetical protein EXS36_06360 [Pedosphaera sp.]|nr:hypothetical protein [Pedosphaera sp.]
MKQCDCPFHRLTNLLLLFAAFFAAPAAPAQIINAAPVPEWILAPGADTNAPAFFRKSFSSDSKLLKAILLGACDGTMDIFVNGAAAGQLSGRDRAGSLDVTALIRPGQNILAIRSKSHAQLSVLLELNGDLARKDFVLSDSTWLTSPTESPDWATTAFAAAGWQSVRSLLRVDATPTTNPFDPTHAIDAYNSWKLALGKNQATDPATFTLPPGFRAELIRSARTNEGSWVSLAFDPHGRLTLAREQRGLLRLTFTSPALNQRREQPTTAPPPEVDRIEVINDTLLECRGLLYAHGALYANANNSKALFRLRDTQGNNQFDEITEIFRTEGGVGHGRNHLKLGPDGWLWIAHGNNVRLPKNLSTNSPLRNFALDRLIPCPWDATMFDGDVELPAGHILRVKPDGSEVQLYAGGFRNPLDLAFNQHGDLFTFDADMEWDVGTPWYMPNRVLHVLPGADFGWRRGASRFPEWFADTLPSVVNIGLASPTGVIFGDDARFPDRYRRAFYIADWAYGRILAVHLTPDGASYTGVSELFIAGRPLNVTDICIGPDGAMWFTTGGRGTQSGLYRVLYVNPLEPPSINSENVPTAHRAVRDQRLQVGKIPSSDSSRAAIDSALQAAGSNDRAVRHAACAALERLPLGAWRNLALSQTNLDALLTTSLALIRLGDTSSKSAILDRIFQTQFVNVTQDQQRASLRVLSLCFIRLDVPDESQRQASLRWIEPLYPSNSRHLNYALLELLVYLHSPNVIAKTIPILRDATASEDLLQYPFYLRYVPDGWTLDARRIVFEALARAERLPGARQYFKAIQDIRRELLAALSPAERETFAPQSAPTSSKPTVAATLFVKNWKMEDLVPRLAEVARGRSWKSARTALTQAQCVLCHRVSNDASLPASIVGPDLTSIASRFNRHDLLEQIIDPSKVIDDKFRSVTLFLVDGSDISGTIETENTNQVILRPSPLSAEAITIPKQTIRLRELSKVSPMPANLLNSLTSEQILDVLAWFEASGNPTLPAFSGR